MSTSVRIGLNHDGIKELLCSSEIAAECKSAAEKIAAAAGEGFEVTEQKMLGYGGGRVGYGVAAETYEARLSESEDKTLSIAVSQCRI